MLTDEEIKSCVLKTWKKMEVVTVPSFDVALETAIRFADALADEKAKPVPKSRTYDVGDVLRCRKAPGVEIRLEQLTGVGSWWALAKGGANRREARIVTRQELDTDYERVPTEQAKPAPAKPCVSRIVEDWLKANDFDGLCNPDRECGCTLNDLMPCNAPHEGDCQAGYAGTPNPSGDRMLYLTREAADAAKKQVR